MSTISNTGPRVLVAMSGGVDSSVAAAVLLERGYEVIGATMHLSRTPAGADAIESARRASERLGIALHVWDGEVLFEREVIGYFVGEYQCGRTPNPCVLCNRVIKFGAFREAFASLGAELLATGHYARVERHGERLGLRRGQWRPKDQSYVLANLSQEQLGACLFPLGELSKDEVRARAAALGLKNADRPESQEICFIPDDDYRAFMTARGAHQEPGPIVNTAGEELGRHQGLAWYTVGQRRGLGIAAPRPLYVLEIDPSRNTLIVGFDEETLCPALHTGPANWVALPPQSAPFRCLAQIRYLHKPAPALAVPEGGGIEVRFDAPQRAIAPGQFCVLYDEDDRVLAGAVITRSTPRTTQPG